MTKQRIIQSCSDVFNKLVDDIKLIVLVDEGADYYRILGKNKDKWKEYT